MTFSVLKSCEEESGYFIAINLVNKYKQKWMDMIITKDRGVCGHEIVNFILRYRKPLLSRINCLK